MGKNIFLELALLTDQEAEICLNDMLRGFMAVRPEYDELFNSPEKLAEAIQLISPVASKFKAPAPKKKPHSIRALLVEIASNSKLNGRLKAALNNPRPTLIEPISGALILAGIIFALSTDIEVKFQNNGGKKKLIVNVRKKPTAAKILNKIIGFFS